MHEKMSYSQFSAIWMAVSPGVGASTRRKRAQRSGSGWCRWRPLMPACWSSMVGIAHCSIKAAPAPRLKHAVRITSKQHTHNQHLVTLSLCSLSLISAVYLPRFSRRSSSSQPLLLFPLLSLFHSHALSLSQRSTPPAVFQLGKKRDRMKRWVREVGKKGGDPRVPGECGPGERKRDKQRHWGARVSQKSSHKTHSITD